MELEQVISAMKADPVLANRKPEKNKRGETVYKKTDRELRNMRENAKREAIKDTMKSYNRKLRIYQKETEARANAYLQVSVNRSLTYVLGLAIKELAGFGYSEELCHEFFDRVRTEFNKCPDMLTSIKYIQELSGWELDPDIDEILYSDDLDGKSPYHPDMMLQALMDLIEMFEPVIRGDERSYKCNMDFNVLDNIMRSYGCVNDDYWKIIEKEKEDEQEEE